MFFKCIKSLHEGQKNKKTQEMRQKKVFLICCLLMINFLGAQVGIGTTQPDTSAILDIRSEGNHKGVLIPRITEAEKNSILSPAEGLMIYQTDGTPGFYYFTRTSWKNQGGITSINGKKPQPNGAINVNLPTTQIGTQATRLSTNSPTDGLIHIVSGEINTLENNKIYIYSSALATWTLTTNFIDTDSDTDTDNQNIAGSNFNNITGELTIGIEGGSSQVVNLATLSGTGTDSQTINASLNGNDLELFLQNTTSSVTVDLSSLAATNTLQEISNAGSSSTNTLTLNTLLPGNVNATLGRSTSAWKSVYVTDMISSTVSATTVSSADINVSQFIKHQNDPDTYILFNPDDIRLVTGGIDALKTIPNEVSVNDGSATVDFRVESDGNSHMLYVDGTNNRVGIGTNTPSQELEVSGTVSASNLIDSSLGGQGEMVFVGPGKRLSSTSSVSLTSSGTLEVSGSVSATNLYASGTISTTNDLFVEGDTRLEGDLTTTDADIVFEDVGGTYPTSGKGFYWRLNNDSAKVYAVQPSSDDINFYFKLEDNAVSDDKYIFWHRDYRGISQDRYPIVANGNYFYVFPPSSGTRGEPDLSSWTLRASDSGSVNIGSSLTVPTLQTTGNTTLGNGTSDFTRVNGNLGINTSTASATLLVAGTSVGSVENERVLRLENSAANFEVFLTDDMSSYGSTPDTTSGLTNLVVFNQSGIGSFVFGDNLLPWTNGGYDLGRTAGRWGTLFAANSTNISSDKRIKSNIIEYSNALERVMQLNPKIYLKHLDQKQEDPGKKEIGFIAQEVAKVIPEMVSIPENSEDLYGLYYNMLIPVLTKAIQEQQEKISASENRIEALEKQNQTMLEELKKIKTLLLESY